ncbi:MAG: ArsR family transcriptional regulator [Candidatus Helarchaeota archaeon]
MDEVLVQKMETEQREVLPKMSPSAQQIYLILKEGPFTPKEILLRTNLSPRTLRYALKKLLGLKLIKKYPNFEDLRQNYYILIE